VRALLLGVTPELAGAAWPDGTTLCAVDRARTMIDALFAHGPGRAAVVGDWRGLPLPAGSIDLAVGDGCLTNLAFPAGYRALAAELGRVLAADGRAVLRLFATPARRESLDEVAAAIGAIAGFHAFKWRLAMAITPADRSVRIDDVWHAFAAMCPDRDALAARTGWPRAVIDTIDAYRGSAVVYSFPTEDEAAAAMSEHLRVIGCTRPAYELGDRCPTLVLAKK
jgi:SAM-dependent methyltransferase